MTTKGIYTLLTMIFLAAGAWTQNNAISNFSVTELPMISDTTGHKDSLLTIVLDTRVNAGDLIGAITLQSGSTSDASDGHKESYKFETVENMVLLRNNAGYFVEQVIDKKLTIVFQINPALRKNNRYWIMRVDYRDGRSETLTAQLF